MLYSKEMENKDEVKVSENNGHHCGIIYNR